jgi:hypothetical protein
MNYIKPEDIKAYVDEHPEGIAGMSEELTAMVNHFAEMIVKEFSNLLFDESERLYAYSSECDNMRESDEAELVAEKCVDLITMIEEHFGVGS